MAGWSGKKTPLGEEQVHDRVCLMVSWDKPTWTRARQSCKKIGCGLSTLVWRALCEYLDHHNLPEDSEKYSFNYQLQSIHPRNYDPATDVNYQPLTSTQEEP